MNRYFKETGDGSPTSKHVEENNRLDTLQKTL